MRIEFIPNGPALLVTGSQRVLVLADTHFGIEAELASRGVHIRSRSRERLERIVATIEAAAPDLLLVIGDLKHSIPMATRQERSEIPTILDRLRALVPLRVIPGNHDAGLERYLREEELLPVRGMEVDGIWYMHGHTYPPPECAAGLFVIGHHHPLVTIRDEVGCALIDRAYLLATLDEECLGLERLACGARKALFMPAFNELGGFDVSKLRESGLGPFSRCMEIEEAEIYLTDGTFLGTLRTLEGRDDSLDRPQN